MSQSLTRRRFHRNLATTLASSSILSGMSLLASSQLSQTTPLRPSAPRFFYNNDGSFLLYCEPPLSADDFVYEAVGRLIGTRVDAVVCHMFSFGDAVPLYPTGIESARGRESSRFELVSEWRRQETLRDFWTKEIDPWKMAVEAAHAAGMQYWVSMRFNDLHPKGYAWLSRFKYEHPEYELGKKCGSGLHSPGSAESEHCTGVNFAIPQVREHRLALIEEVCSRYNVEGFEWDFLRHPGHHFPAFSQGRQILTDYMRRVRTTLQKIGERRGRALGFGIRVPATLEKCHRIGLDVASWISERLVDYVSPAPYADTATDFPFDTFVSLTQRTQCRIYACPSDCYGPGRHQYPSSEVLRAGALNAWKKGVDGIYLYNFHHPTIYNDSMTEVLHQLDLQASLQFHDKQYVVTGPYTTLKYPNFTSVFEAYSYQLPMKLSEQSSKPNPAISFEVGDDLTTAKRRGILASITLELGVFGYTSEDRMEFKLNGRILPGNPHVQLHPEDYRTRPDWYAYRGNLLLNYDLDVEWIQSGRNQLDVALKRRNPRLSSDLVLQNLALTIRYRALPMRINREEVPSTRANVGAVIEQ
jgi:hypothetical protein